MKITQHGPIAFVVEGEGFYGVFATRPRAEAWGALRQSGAPYNPIPKAGEA